MIRKLAATLLGLLVALPPLAASADGVAWQTSTLDEALAAAGAADSLVLVDVYATWCGPCQLQEREVFPADVVGAATADMVAIRVDAERGEGPAVAERYHVVGFPTVLLIRPDGTEIDRVFGFMPAEEFARTLTGYRQGQGTIEDLRSQVEADPNDMSRVFELGFRLAVRGEYDEAQRLLDRVIGADEANAAGLRAQAHLVLGKYMYLRGTSDYPAALAQFDILVQQFPDTDEAHEARFQSAIARARMGDEAGAEAEIEAILADNPTDVDTYNALAWACYRENFQLERGVEIARRGLAIDPTAHALWDTLAELQNALGDPAAALESIRQAHALAPDDDYYQRQLERFSALAGAPD